MENYIQNPMSNKEWNPQLGDFFSRKVYEEDLLYERRQFRRKMMVSGLLSIHMIALVAVLLYLA